MRRDASRSQVKNKAVSVDSQQHGEQPLSKPEYESLSHPPINPGIKQTEVPGDSSEESKREKNTAGELAREFKTFEKLSLIINGVLALIGIGALIVYNGQLNVMRGQLEEMRRSGLSATDQMWQAIGNINWLARSMEGSMRQSRESLSATLKQGKVALDTSIAIAHSEQRAWIVTRTPSSPASFAAKGPITFPVSFVNIGKTPAANVEESVRVQLIQSGKEPSFSYEPGTSMSFRSGDLVPNDEISHEIPARANRDPIILTLDEVSRLLDGSEYAAFYGDVTYEDISGPHWMRFCRELYKGPTDMWYPKKCYAYNSSGDGKVPPKMPAK